MGARAIRGARRAVLVTATVAVSLVPLGPRATAGGGAARVVPSSLNPSSTENKLNGVNAVSGTNAWAVGEYVDDTTHAHDTLILHWNGTKWSKVTSPNPGTQYNVLQAVRAVSAQNAWAVGNYVDDQGAYRTLILHWNGTKWSQVASPHPSSTQSYLLGVNGGGSQGPARAVGYYEDDTSHGFRTLAAHWTGSKWVLDSTPSPASTNNYLGGVREPAASNAWAVGEDQTVGGLETLILHWNGTKWSRVTSPNGPDIESALASTSGASPSNGWAVGDYGDGADYFTLILHWNGTKWTRVDSPSPSAIDNELHSVRATSTTDAWAVGTFISGPGVYDTLIEHWNGHAWSVVVSPNPSATTNFLNAVVSTSATNAWAVGYDYDSPVYHTLILHWNGHTWVQQ